MKNFQLSIKSIRMETADALTIVFDQPQEGPLQYHAGQFLTLVLAIEGKSVRRAYSLNTAPSLDKYPAVTVKRVENGLVSNFIHDTLKEGDSIEVLEPMGQFTTEIKPQQARHVVLLGGGSGITPLMALLKDILSHEPESQVSLIYANRDPESIIFREGLKEWAQKFPERFRVLHILEDPKDFAEPHYAGRLNTPVLREMLGRLSLNESKQLEYFMCGPGGMMQQIEKSFSELGIPMEQLRKESFGISPEEAAQKKAERVEDGENLQSREVKVQYAGETYTFKVSPDKTILQAAMDHDIDLPYSCQSGMCTACMGRTSSGKVEMEEEEALTPKEIEQGYVLTCVGHPKTDDVVIIID